MAEKRMFTKKIIDSDAFIKLPSAAQALYFHLNQGADDDGFNNQIQLAILKAHATEEDLKRLMDKNFVIYFEVGVVVIKHWRMHNTLRKDRYTPTNYCEEFKLLDIKDNGAYSLGCQVVAKRLPQSSVEKNSLDKIRLEKSNVCGENSATYDTTNEEKPDNLKKVRLSSEQVEDLKKRMGSDNYNWYVDKLAKFILEKRANVKSCYETILKWYEEDSQASKKKAEKKKVRYGNFDASEAFQKALKRSYADLTEEDSEDEQSDT